MVRVIAGEARGRKLKTVDSEATKPTLDRVKEAMFGMLIPYLPNARVLDLFSGNGSLGIEAISRGSAFCIFNDKSSACVKLIRENVETVGFTDRAEFICNDFAATVNTLKNRKEKIDLVLLDPPYSHGFIEKSLELLSSSGICVSEENKHTVCLCEHSVNDILVDKYGKFVKIKDRHYGTVAVSVFEYEGEGK